MFTLTDRPYETMWRHLRLLSHEKNARRLLQGELSAGRTWCPTSEDLEIKARQVAYCIVQAFEYYKAADAVTIELVRYCTFTECSRSRRHSSWLTNPRRFSKT